MTKYILKESELKAMIENIVTEELGQLDEGFWRGLWNVAKGTAGMVVNPYGTVGNMFSNPGKSGSGFRSGGGVSRGGSGTRRKTRAERQRERLLANKSLSFEYGRPETVPAWGNRVKLDKKSEIVAPNNNNEVPDWGTFGKHYHDENDNAWRRMVASKENALIRNSRGNQARMVRLQRKYKKILLNWLKERDKAYEIYIKSNNKL